MNDGLTQTRLAEFDGNAVFGDQAADAIIIAGVVSVTGKEPSSGRRSWAGATRRDLQLQQCVQVHLLLRVYEQFFWKGNRS